jgi:hypothetical protein
MAGYFQEVIKDIASLYEITSKENVSDFLGVNISTDIEGNIALTQQNLIQSILVDLKLDGKVNTRTTPALSTVILQAYGDSTPHDADLSYRAVIGKLNYLEKSTRPDIAYAVHQCARYTSDPKVEHTKAVKAIGRYLAGTIDKGVQFQPTAAGLECFVDANFAGNWVKPTAEDDPFKARSRTGYVIKFAGCLLLWASKLQTEISLSSTESEYIALSQALREVIPLIALIKELKLNNFDIKSEQPMVLCKVFEDNNGALEMAKTPKLRPRTKHINVKYHHFREAVHCGDITIHKVNTTEQQADIFTKPLPQSIFKYLRKLLMGW